MNYRTLRQQILAAAVGLTLAGPAFAQYRTSADGRARDASNRIGSGGYNDGGNSSQNIYNNSLGNQLITGTVTGGKAFNFGNNTPYADPRQFRGNTANNVSDQFIKNSSGAPFGGVSQANAQVTQPFYGSRLATAPPPGFVQQAPGSGAFVPSSATLTRAPGDYRLGNVTPLSAPLAQTPQPGQLFLPGPVDANTQSLTVASPLYGVRSVNPNNLMDQSFLQPGARTSDLSSQIDPTTLQQLRSELTAPPTNNSLNGGPLNNSGNMPGADQGQNGQNVSPNQLQSTQLQSTQLTNPFGQATNQPLDNRVNSLGNQSQGNVGNTGPLNNGLSTGAGINGGIQQRSNLMAPERQSTQLAQLNDRLNQYRQLQQPGMISTQSRNQGPSQRKTSDTGTAKTASPSGPTPAAQANTETTPIAPRPGVVVAPNGNTGIVPPTMGGPTQQSMNPIDMVGTMPNMPSAMNLPKPVQIHSLAEGVQAKGLADLLKQAEDDAKAQHYSTALEQYDLAEQVAPNNPLIGLGRANVELAQGYYSRAENHLKDAFTKNPQLLMGQYDLRALLGDDRLDFLVKDLKERAKSDSKNAGPLFLLAYVAYNTNNERMAAGYIDLAQKRAGDDKVYGLIRSHWSLPTTSNQLPSQNK